MAGSFFSLLYLENNGTFRWFCVFGAAVGMLVVKSTASPFLVKSWSAVRSLDKKGDFLCCRMADASRKVYLSNRKNGFRKFSEVPDGVQEF